MESAPRRVVVLGSTGSVGAQALEVIAAQGDRLQLVGVAVDSSWSSALDAAARHGCVDVAVCDPFSARAAHQHRDGAGDRAFTIHESVVGLLDATSPDLVLNSIVGFAGLAATLSALERGIDVALANKESLVAAGSLCMQVARERGARIIPVDSEHSALQQCVGSSAPSELASLVLTASGGPFRGRDRADLRDVTVAEALAHPTWSMGGKISIDSATLMNKGLELIEAVVLFDVAPDDVEIVVHPDSIVHALVRHVDGSLLAHLGWPDMRVPISWALMWPERGPLDLARTLDLVDMPALRFERPDTETFGCLRLAREAAEAGGGAPCVINAANEVAVDAFLDGRIPFLTIEDLVARALHDLGAEPEPRSLDEAELIDSRARACAHQALGALA